MDAVSATPHNSDIEPPIDREPDMTAIAEIKDAITQLSPEQLTELRQWFDEWEGDELTNDSLRRQIQVGLDDESAGRVAPLEMDDIREEVRSRVANR